MNLNIPVPKTPFFVTETATGQQVISREWYRFFTDMGFALGYDTNGIFDIAAVVTPPAETVLAGFISALAAKVLEADDHAAQVMGVLEGLKVQLANMEAPVPRALTEAEIQLRDVLTNNVSIARHGFAPIAPNDATKFLDGTGAYSTPAGSGGTVTTTGSPASGNLTKFSGATSITNGDLSGDVTTSGTLVVTIPADTVTNAQLANATAYSLKANLTSGSANPTDAIYTDWTTVSPTGADFAIGFDSSGVPKKYTVASFAGGSGGAVGPGTGIYEARGPAVPAYASFSAVNSASGSDVTNALLLSSTNTTANLRILEQASISTPFSLYTRAHPICTITNFIQWGICVRNSTSGRVLTFGFLCTGGSVSRQFARWASPTSFSASIGTDLQVIDGTYGWLRLDVTSTTVTPFMSYDGWNWQQHGSAETISAYLTATGGSLDKIGLFVNPQGADIAAYFYNWGTTAPV